MYAFGHIQGPAVYRLRVEDVLIPQIKHDRREVGNQRGRYHKHCDSEGEAHREQIVLFRHNKDDQHEAKQQIDPLHPER
ncbi:hypothetical protein D3C73_1137040 [compost metagenome]